MADMHGPLTPPPDPHKDGLHCLHPIPGEASFHKCCWCGKEDAPDNLTPAKLAATPKEEALDGLV